MAPTRTGLRAAALCLLAWAGLALSDRIYVHPFHLLLYTMNSCSQLEEPGAPLRSEQGFTPLPVQTAPTPVDEAAIRKDLLHNADRVKLENRMRATKVGMTANVLGFRLYKLLRESGRDPAGGVVLSPTTLYGTLASLYLGARGSTARQLLALLGVSNQSQDCTSWLDGEKVFLGLQGIQKILVSQDATGRQARLLLSTMANMFTVPSLRLRPSYVQRLAPFAVFSSRSLNLTADPDLVSDSINTFLQSLTGWKVGRPPAAVSADSTLLLNTYVHSQVKIKGFVRLAEPQEFHVDNTTSVLIPMIAANGIFLYKNDVEGNFSVTGVFLGESAILLLIQPHAGSNMDRVAEPDFYYEFLGWTKAMSPRAMRLTLPEMEVRASQDWQGLLKQANQLTLERQNLREISDPSPIVGEVVSGVLFELRADETEQSAPQPMAPDALEVTLNSPFLFALYEYQARAVHVLGRVNNPQSLA
ncbi:angiotensinogen [Ctenodactylus gundi]